MYKLGMMDTIYNAKHVIRTSDYCVEVLSYDSKNSLIGRVQYPTRQGAIHAVENMTGKKIVLKPMQTADAERVFYDEPDLGDD